MDSSIADGQVISGLGNVAVSDLGPGTNLSGITTTGIKSATVLRDLTFNVI